MAANDYFAILTAAGEAKLAAAAANQTPLKLTTMAVGDGAGNNQPPDHRQTALRGEVYRAALNQLAPDQNDPSLLLAEMIIPESVGGWWVREIALFDEDGDMCAVANCPDSYKPLLVNGSGKVQIIRMLLVVSSSSAVELKIDPGIVLAPRSYVDSAITAAMQKFSDLIFASDYTGDAKLAADAADGKVYFVPPGAAVTLQVPQQYPHLNAALAAIARWQIPASSSLEIAIAAGSHAMPGATLVSHPCAEQITIRGQQTVITTTLGGQIAVTGARGAWLVELAVASTAGLAAGDWVMIRDTAGAGDHYAHRGFFEVTTVKAASIVVRNRHRAAAFPASQLTGGSVYRMGTILRYDRCDGFVVRGSSLGLLRDVGIVGNCWDYWNENDVAGTERGTHGIYVGSNTIIDGTAAPGGANPNGIGGGSISLGEYVCVANFDQQGICAMGGSIYGRGAVSCSNARRGFYAGTSATIEIKFCIAAGNVKDGVIADYGGAFNTSWASLTGNGGDGGFAFNGGALIAPNSSATGNGLHGFEARGGSTVNTDGGTASYNAADGFHAEYGGRLSCVSGTAQGNSSHGACAVMGAVMRANAATLSGNAKYGAYATDMGIIVNSGGARNDNVLGAIYARQLAIVLDGTSYTDSTWSNISQLALRNGANSCELAISTTGDLGVTFNGTSRLQAKVDGTFFPSVDGSPTLGRANNRWNTIYSIQATINTSDVHEKQDIAAIDDELIEAFLSITPQTYRYRSAVASKGDAARVHMGYIAQHLEQALRATGADPARYAIWCRDQLTELVPDGEIVVGHDEDGTPITQQTYKEQAVVDDDGRPIYRQGLRYEHFIALQDAANRKLHALSAGRLAALEARLAALESKP